MKIAILSRNRNPLFDKAVGGSSGEPGHSVQVIDICAAT